MYSVMEVPSLNNERMDLLQLDPTAADFSLPADIFLEAAVSLKHQVVDATWRGRDGGGSGGVMDPTVFSGLLGTAFTCLRSYEITGDRNDLLLCADMVDTCFSVARASSRHVTFLCGRGGAYALGCVAADCQGDHQRRDLFLNLFFELAQERALPVGPEEGGFGMSYDLLYGRAGFLWAALFINKHLGQGTVADDLVRPIVDAVVAGGRAGASDHTACPLMYRWHGTRYWGAPNGLAGILHVLLHFSLSEQDSDDVKGTLRYMMSNRFPHSGNYPSSEGNPRDKLVRWSHGATSMAMTLAKASQMERYEILRDIGSGNFGVAKLVKDKCTNNLFAVKFIERGSKIDEHVQREIINHRSLKHPNIIRFKEVLLTPTHLAIVMEYAAGGELFERICNAGRFSEDEARYFFQQLVSGVGYCHVMQICHRDLKLENTLLDGSEAPRLKICDFGYSKSAVFHSQPKSTVGTPAYIAPEVLSRKEYDGKVADVWSCGVTLYVMLVGAYPFEDPDDPRNFKKTIQRIINVHYSIPDYVRISADCKHLLSGIFVADPEKRITMVEIIRHPWFLKNLAVEFMEELKVGGDMQADDQLQSLGDVMTIIQEARDPGETIKINGDFLLGLGGSMDVDDISDADLEDLEGSGDFVCSL